MKLLKKNHEKFTFELMLEERELLIEILKFYPMLDYSRFEISKTVKNDEVVQSRKILQEALAEHQQENKRMMHEIFESSDILKPKKNPDYYILELNPEQIERLLQVLNDIRIGTWHKLGCPDYENREQIIKSAQDIVSIYIMDICEYFEYYLLKALGY